MNACQMLDRRAIRNCLREHDADFHSFFHYSRPRRQRYRHEDRTVGMVALSCQGVTQGDALSVAVFDIVYTYLVLKPACERLTDAHFVAIHDDTYIRAALDKRIEINDFLTECAAAMVQDIPKKGCVFQLPTPRALPPPT
jgi:hypothetical protein